MRPPLLFALVGAACALASGLASAQRQPRTSGIESDEYVWNEEREKTVEALRLDGNIVNGEKLYRERCAGCHLPSGAGLRDGTYPQLAGQHRSVIIKQIIDILDGRRDNGKGPGHDLEHGRELYERDCVRCHGARGEGDAARYYPVLAGQHYEYLFRQIDHIADGRRRNANPEMVEIVAPYSDRDREAVVDYMSRLEWPERLESP